MKFYTHYNLVFVKNTLLLKFSYVLLSQSNILLTMANMVVEFFFICRKLLTLNHEHYEIRGNVLSWFKSYLCGRSQYVSVNGFPSDLLPNTFGVLQGSVLAPLLFVLCVNDLPNISKVLELYLFADDTSIYYESDNLPTLQKIVNRELRKVRKWLEANRLPLNIGKTNYVISH